MSTSSEDAPEVRPHLTARRWRLSNEAPILLAIAILLGAWLLLTFAD